MTKEEILIRSILGLCRKDVRTLAYAVGEAEELLFYRKIPMDDILVTKHIYPAVAERTGKSYKAVSRQIERLGNLCWDSLDEKQKMSYIGKPLKDIRAPRDMIFYLAFYSHFDKPYYEIIYKNPSLLFGENENLKI